MEGRVGGCHTQNFVEIPPQVRGPEPLKAEVSRARAEGSRARAFAITTTTTTTTSPLVVVIDVVVVVLLLKKFFMGGLTRV